MEVIHPSDEIKIKNERSSCYFKAHYRNCDRLTENYIKIFKETKQQIYKNQLLLSARSEIASHP